MTFSRQYLHTYVIHCRVSPFSMFYGRLVFRISGLAEHLTLLRFSRQINSMSIRGVDYVHHNIGPGCPHLYFPPGLHLGCLTAEPWFVARSRIKLPTKKCELCQCRSPHSQKSGRSYLSNKRKGRLFVIVFFNLYLI